MTRYETGLYNVTKLLSMAVFGVLAIAALAFVLLWPLLLWWYFGQALSVAVALTTIWIASIQ